MAYRAALSDTRRQKDAVPQRHRCLGGHAALRRLEMVSAQVAIKSCFLLEL